MRIISRDRAAARPARWSSCAPSTAPTGWPSSSARGGADAVAIHGDLGQGARQRALDDFTDGRSRVLVATDVAARGLHVDDLDLVVHYDPPADHKDYLHRSGRTARAGASGVVLSLLLADQRRTAERLFAAAGVKVRSGAVRPGDPAVRELATSGDGGRAADRRARPPRRPRLGPRGAARRRPAWADRAGRPRRDRAGQRSRKSSRAGPRPRPDGEAAPPDAKPRRWRSPTAATDRSSGRAPASRRRQPRVVGGRLRRRGPLVPTQGVDRGRSSGAPGRPRVAAGRRSRVAEVVAPGLNHRSARRLRPTGGPTGRCRSPASAGRCPTVRPGRRPGAAARWPRPERPSMSTRARRCPGACCAEPGWSSPSENEWLVTVMLLMSSPFLGRVRDLEIVRSRASETRTQRLSRPRQALCTERSSRSRDAPKPIYAGAIIGRL